MAIKRWNASASQWELVGTPGTATPSAIGAATITSNTFSGVQTIAAASEWPLISRFTNSASTHRNHLLLQRSNNNAAVTSGFTLGGIAMSGHDGTNYGYGWNGGAEITAYAAETWTSSARGTHLAFFNTAIGTNSIIERMRIDASGNLGLGISTLSTHNPDLSYNKTFALTQSDQTLTLGSYWQGGVGQSSFINSSQASSRSAASPLFIQTGGLTRLAFDNSGNIQMTNQAVDTLRYFDIYNTSSGNSAGTIIRMITNNAANSGVTTVDVVKYRNGYFGILNNDSAGVTGFGTAGAERMRIDAAGKMSLSAISRDTSSQVRNITLSTSAASGGNDGDVWLTYTA